MRIIAHHALRRLSCACRTPAISPRSTCREEALRLKAWILLLQLATKHVCEIFTKFAMPVLPNHLGDGLVVPLLEYAHGLLLRWVLPPWIIPPAPEHEIACVAHDVSRTVGFVIRVRSPLDVVHSNQTPETMDSRPEPIESIHEIHPSCASFPPTWPHTSTAWRCPPGLARSAHRLGVNPPGAAGRSSLLRGRSRTIGCSPMVSPWSSKYAKSHVESLDFLERSVSNPVLGHFRPPSPTVPLDREPV